MRALIVIVAACAHREPPPQPPATMPVTATPVDAAVADAPPVPTATGDWEKQEIASQRTPAGSDAPSSDVVIRYPFNEP